MCGYFTTYSKHIGIFSDVERKIIQFWRCSDNDYMTTSPVKLILSPLWTLKLSIENHNNDIHLSLSVLKTFIPPLPRIGRNILITTNRGLKLLTWLPVKCYKSIITSGLQNAVSHIVTFPQPLKFRAVTSFSIRASQSEQKLWLFDAPDTKMFLNLKKRGLTRRPNSLNGGGRNSARKFDWSWRGGPCRREGPAGRPFSTLIRVLLIAKCC